MMIRPQRKKEKETKAMINAMKVGDKVVTIGGICGKVAKIKDEYVFIETGNIGTPDQKSVVKMERDAIRTCLLYTSDAADEEDREDIGGRRLNKKKKQ